MKRNVIAWWQRIREFFSDAAPTIAAPILVSEFPATEAPTEPKLNWIYQPPAKGASYEQWRESNAGMPDCDEARQIFQKHQ